MDMDMDIHEEYQILNFQDFFEKNFHQLIFLFITFIITMGILMKENEEKLNDENSYQQSPENSFEQSHENVGFDIPREYPYPCPFLTPENLGYSRPDPYPYSRY
jgi:hypothetical protein